MDAHTRFGIASNSKAFTATALGMLVEEGKIEWDAPVVQYMPGFALSDPYVTAHLTVRDLLVHRSGLSLGAGDLLWWPASTLTRKESVQRLRFLPITGRFRDGYAYDNVLYMVAGELVEAVTGQTWEQFVQARLLGPLGMADARASLSDAAEASTPAANVSGTHGLVGTATAAVPPLTTNNANPAAGIGASASDMAAWMVAQLDSGRVAGGTRLWQRATTEQLWSVATVIAAQTRVAPGREALKSDFAGYGLGFFLNQYRGHKMVWHTGGLPGYVSRVTMLPDRKIGVAVLTNAESGLAFNALTYRMLDLALGGEVQDWTATFAPFQARQAASIAALAEPPAADASAPPTRPLATYAGTYRDPWYGDVVRGAGRGRIAPPLRAQPGPRRRAPAPPPRHVRRPLGRPHAPRRRLRHLCLRRRRPRARRAHGPRLRRRGLLVRLRRPPPHPRPIAALP